MGATPDAAIEDAVEHAVRVGPLERALKGVSDDVREQALEVVRKAFGLKLYADGVRIEGAAWIVTARPA